MHGDHALPPVAKIAKVEQWRRGLAVVRRGQFADTVRLGVLPPNVPKLWGPGHAAFIRGPLHCGRGLPLRHCAV